MIRKAVLLLLLASSLMAQQGAKYYEERLRPYKNVPINGNGSYYLIHIRSSVMQESDVGALTYLQSEIRLGGYLDMGYLGLYSELYSRVADVSNYFMEISSYLRNNGYDEENIISWPLTLSSNFFPQKVYPENYFLIFRDYSPWIPEIRIGKLWFDFNAYTIYRTWGLEGVELKQTLPVYFIDPFFSKKFTFKYDAFLSYNKVKNVVDSSDSALYDRFLLGGEYILRSSELGFQAVAVNANYNVFNNAYNASFLEKLKNIKKDSENKIRQDDTYSLKVSQRLLFSFYVNGMYVLQNHYEYKEDKIYENQYSQRYEVANYNGIINFGAGYRETSPDFMPVDYKTWYKYPPFNSTAYSWNYEEQRMILGNDKAYFGWIKKNWLGIDMDFYYEYSQYLTSTNIYAWRKTSLPGHKFRLSAYYKLFNIEIHNRYYGYKGIVYSSDGAEIYKIAGVLENEMYYPLTGSMSVDVKSRVFRKMKPDGQLNYMKSLFFLLDYKINRFVKIKAEGKVTSPSSDEPVWLMTAKDYMDQSAWGVDNYIKLSLITQF